MVFNLTLSQTDKRYLSALIVIMGIILFWRGLWDALYFIPIIENPFVSLFLGLLIMTLSGVIFQEFDPLRREVEKSIELLNEVVSRKHAKDKYEVVYFDEILGRTRSVGHHLIKKMEHTFVVVEDKGKEFFIPVHRIRKIKQNNKVIWEK